VTICHTVPTSPGHDESQVEAGKRFIQDLEDLNKQFASGFISRTTQFLFTTENHIWQKPLQHWRPGRLPLHLLEVRSSPCAYRKIAVGLSDFPARRPAHPWRPGRTAPKPTTEWSTADPGRARLLRGERATDHAPATTATLVTSAPAGEGEVAAAAAASTEMGHA
jgi:hypothetical protein